MLFEDMAFTCWVMEQEGVLDCRSRQEKIENFIQVLAAAGEMSNDPYFQRKALNDCALSDLTENEILYIEAELTYLAEEM